MSFAKKNRRRFEPLAAQRFVLPRTPTFPMARVVVLALLSAVAAAWAIAYHYTAPRPPMLVPVKPHPPAPSATYDADAGEIPVELEPPP